MADPRIEELEALALEEGFRLPMAADLIAYLEQHGYVVDLCSGEVCQGIAVALSPNAQALCHLYGVEDGDLDTIFAPAAVEVVEFDLFDYEGELEDYQDDIEDRAFWARGDW